jgi:hypothetical protein
LVSCDHLAELLIEENEPVRHVEKPVRAKHSNRKPVLLCERDRSGVKRV